MSLQTTVETFQPTDQCSLCKGRCCKNYPGSYSPKDFNPLSFEVLKHLLLKGLVKVDWWEADRPGYFLRPTASTDDDRYFIGSWGGICIHLTDLGCKLAFEKRPLGCRALKPGSDFREHGCHTEYGKYESYKEWEQYSNLFRQLKEL